MSNSNLRNKKRLFWDLNPGLSISTKESSCTSNDSEEKESKYFKMFKILIPFLFPSLSASLLWHGWHSWPFLECSLTHLACPSLETFSPFLYFEPAPGCGEPFLWPSLEGVLGQVPAFTVSSARPPVHRACLELQPIFPSGSCSTGALDLEDTGWRQPWLYLWHLWLGCSTSLSLLLLVELKNHCFSDGIPHWEQRDNA